jgi:site-specific recombinase XerD
MGAIKEKMKRDMEIRGFSARTRQTYLECVTQFVKYFMKSPDLLSLDDIHTYQLHMIKECQYATNTINLHVAALKFLFGQTLQREWRIELIPYFKRGKRLPVVLSREEVRRLYHAVSYLKHRAMILTLYSTGIRVSELTHLKVTDIDSERMLIRIEEGKNRKDRYVSLSEKLLDILRRYWKAEEHKSRTWLFPGRGENAPLNRSSVAKMIRSVRIKAAISKQVTTHTLRHTYATHMLEAGEDIRKIQLLMGHRCIGTTSLYLHVASRDLREAKNPLDTLDLD